MSNGSVRDPKSGKRVLRFIATAAVVVAPMSLAACGGSQSGEETMNVDHTPEPHTNVAPEEEPPHTNVAPEEEPPHTNVAQEEEPEPLD